jgi:hypothetical protein
MIAACPPLVGGMVTLCRCVTMHYGAGAARGAPAANEASRLAKPCNQQTQLGLAGLHIARHGTWLRANRAVTLHFLLLPLSPGERRLGAVHANNAG